MTTHSHSATTSTALAPASCPTHKSPARGRFLFRSDFNEIKFQRINSADIDATHYKTRAQRSAASEGFPTTEFSGSARL